MVHGKGCEIAAAARVEVLKTYMNDKPPKAMLANSQLRKLEITW